LQVSLTVIESCKNIYRRYQKVKSFLKHLYQILWKIRNQHISQFLSIFRIKAQDENRYFEIS